MTANLPWRTMASMSHASRGTTDSDINPDVNGMEGIFVCICLAARVTNRTASPSTHLTFSGETLFGNQCRHNSQEAATKDTAL